MGDGSFRILLDRNLRWLFDGDTAYVKSLSRPQNRARIAFFVAKLLHETAEILMESHPDVRWATGQLDPELPNTEAVAYRMELRFLAQIPDFATHFKSLIQLNPLLWTHLYQPALQRGRDMETWLNNAPGHDTIRRYLTALTYKGETVTPSRLAELEPHIEAYAAVRLKELEDLARQRDQQRGHPPEPTFRDADADAESAAGHDAEMSRPAPTSVPGAREVDAVSATPNEPDLSGHYVDTLYVLDARIQKMVPLRFVPMAALTEEERFRIAETVKEWSRENMNVNSNLFNSFLDRLRSGKAHEMYFALSADGALDGYVELHKHLTGAQVTLIKIHPDNILRCRLQGVGDELITAVFRTFTQRPEYAGTLHIYNPSPLLRDALKRLAPEVPYADDLNLIFRISADDAQKIVDRQRRKVAELVQQHGLAAPASRGAGTGEAEIDRLPLDGALIEARLKELDEKHAEYLEGVERIGSAGWPGGRLREGAEDMQGCAARAVRYARLLAAMKRYAGPLAKKRMLEIGPGSGAFLLALRDLGVVADGLELTSTMITLAQKFVGLTLIPESVLDPPPSIFEQPYDVTFSRAMLGALRDQDEYAILGKIEWDRQALLQFARFTTPGGISLHEALEPFGFTEDDIRAAGFEVLEGSIAEGFLVLRRTEVDADRLEETEAKAEQVRSIRVTDESN